MTYQDEQKKIATGVTDGSIRGCMTQDEIVAMARYAGIEDSNEYDHLVCTEVELLAFAKLVAAKERQRIISVNASEIEKCNAYIKELEDNLARGKA